MVVTEPTAFYGDIFSRIRDPWSNLWWVYQYGENANWNGEITDEDEAWSSESDPETLKSLQYIYDTLMGAMNKVGTEQQ